ncbi:discoidin domain-containing protein [Ilumatobacter sp.]|uniref:discoidin domain-containing protein n=1 Tax=Ilumatobacter sp. TaxID=1967498 RepID=UPI003C44B486
MNPQFTRRSVVTVAAASAVLAACGGSSDGDDIAADGGDGGDAAFGQLLPFSQVQANEFTFEADPSDPGRGIFRVRTTVPMICAIVWGETEEFGNFNNSLAMNGTGITEHDVSLPGATAGPTYFFRVQGTTADGNQYRSELGTFTIPAIESDGESVDPSTRGDNLSANATVAEVSSVFGPGFEAENAIDGDTNTEWSSGGDGDNGFIVIDLGSEQDIGGVEFLSRSMLDGSATTETFTVSIGDDSFGPFGAGNPANPRFTELTATGQLIRFDVEASTGGNVGAIEVNIYAPVGS